MKNIKASNYKPSNEMTKTKSKEKLNPFEVHINHTKHKILGQKSKDDRGLPGVSRGKAFHKREQTLLGEYRDRNKSNKFVDKRIGEKDKFLDPEKKILLRVAAEKKRQFSKKSLFNLNDDEQLTHGGEVLNETTMKDGKTFSDDDEDDDLLDASYVGDKHFGGDLFQKPGDHQGGSGNKSRKEMIEEIIANSKKKKAENKKDKEIQNDAVSKLDSQFKDFLSLLKGKTMTDEDKEKSKKTCDFRDYDTHVRSLQFDHSKRASALDKLKTEGELAKEEEEKLRKLEDDRLRRMRGDLEDQPGYSQSADALDDGFMFMPPKAAPESPARVSSPPLTQVNTSKKTKRNTTTKESKEKEDEDDKEELPFTFEVPVDYDGFWDLLQTRSPPEVSTIVGRMITCNHPKLGADQKNKANTIFAYLLQTLHIVCAPDPEYIDEEVSPFLYIDALIPHLYALTQLNPSDCAAALNQVIDEKFDEYSKNSKSFPFADTFVFLKVSGLLFPSSDFNHAVMTRVMVFLAQILAEARLKDARDVVALCFSASLVFEYLHRSGRFLGELSNALNGLLYVSIPTDASSVQLPHTPPFRAVGPLSEMLVLEEPCDCFEPSKFKFCSINEDSPLTDSFKVQALNLSLTLLNKLCHTWAPLASVRAIFAPTSRLLSALPLSTYPEQTKELVQVLRESISGLPKQPAHLCKAEGQVKTLKMMEPIVEEVLEGMKKRGGSRGFQEKQKLVHKLRRERKGAKRELKRDNQFIAKQQLNETLQNDAIRKRKVNLIMQGLSVQESEFQKFKKCKKK